MKLAHLLVSLALTASCFTFPSPHLLANESGTIAIRTVAIRNATDISSADPIAELETWLKTSPDERPKLAEQDFAEADLSLEQTRQAKKMLLADAAERLRKEREAEWNAKEIKLGDLKMKFDYRVFGDKPAKGRSLFISMHGGGGAPARVNDQQWKNQIRLYEPKEGIYLAPRAPTNTWNLWHQGHIDDFFQRIIEDAVLFADVNPNRVYIMGYSAGGDGVYQLAPRFADRLAAAAMMAGHPNDASPLGLRNIGFTLHMGGKDAAYNRNGVARQWKKKLAKLKEDDSQGYKHKVVIHEQYGHWMNRDDRVAVPWMAKFTRNPYPKRIVWYQSGRTHDQFYWLSVGKENRIGGSHVVVDYTPATAESPPIFEIRKAEKVSSLKILLNEELLAQGEGTPSAGMEILVKVKDGKAGRYAYQPTIKSMIRSLHRRFDPAAVYSAELIVPLDGVKEPE